MTKAAVAAEVHQSLDADGEVAAKIAFDLVLTLEHVADLLQLVVVEIVDALGRRNAGLLADLRGRGLPHAVDVLEPDEDVLSSGKIDACDTCHVLFLSNRISSWKRVADQPWRCLWRGSSQM